MDTMRKFAIVGETNGYIANRDIRFNGKTTVTLETFDTLEEANQELLQWCKQDHQLHGQWNWPLVKAKGYGNCRKDGTRMYEYDSRYYYTQQLD